jgi:hypothetical protein
VTKTENFIYQNIGTTKLQENTLLGVHPFKRLKLEVKPIPTIYQIHPNEASKQSDSSVGGPVYIQALIVMQY